MCPHTVYPCHSHENRREAHMPPSRVARIPATGRQAAGSGARALRGRTLVEAMRSISAGVSCRPLR